MMNKIPLLLACLVLVDCGPSSGHWDGKAPSSVCLSGESISQWVKEDGPGSVSRMADECGLDGAAAILELQNLDSKNPATMGLTRHPDQAVPAARLWASFVRLSATGSFGVGIDDSAPAVSAEDGIHLVQRNQEPSDFRIWIFADPSSTTRVLLEDIHVDVPKVEVAQ